jgi:hypothetical protein
MSYYYASSLLNKEWNGGLFIRYHLSLYTIRDTPSALNIGIPFRVNSLLISQRYNHGCA